MCSPGLACDPSSVCTRASTARLTAAVQGLQGPGSRPVPLRVAHDPDRPTAVLRPTLRCETTLTWRCELRAAPSTWLRRARAFACLACASRGWPGSIPKASSDLRSGQGVRAPTAVLGLRRGARSGELRRVCVQASPCSIPLVALRQFRKIQSIRSILIDVLPYETRTKSKASDPDRS